MSDMKAIMWTVATQAAMWWRSKRPEDWTEEQHLDDPHVNCVGAYERALAGCVAYYVREVQLRKQALERERDDE